MIYGLILLCAAGVHPAACLPSNARDVIMVPDGAPTPLGCLVKAQEYLVKVPHEDGDSVRIICRPRKENGA